MFGRATITLGIGPHSSLVLFLMAGGSLISPGGVAPSWIVGVSASVIFPCTIKSRSRFFLAPAHVGCRGKGP